MDKLKIAVIGVALLCATLTAQAGDEHTIRDINDDIIILDDGSIYRSMDIDSALWMPLSDVIVTDSGDKIINVDEGESVDVIQLH
jgi:hypothetical protein